MGGLPFLAFHASHLALPAKWRRLLSGVLEDFYAQTRCEVSREAYSNPFSRSAYQIGDSIWALTLLIKDSRLAGVDISHCPLLIQSIQFQLVVVACSIRQGLGVLSCLFELFLHLTCWYSRQQQQPIRTRIHLEMTITYSVTPKGFAK